MNISLRHQRWFRRAFLLFFELKRDGMDVIPFDRIAAFFTKNLK